MFLFKKKKYLVRCVTEEEIPRVPSLFFFYSGVLCFYLFIFISRLFGYERIDLHGIRSLARFTTRAK